MARWLIHQGQGGGGDFHLIDSIEIIAYTQKEQACPARALHALDHLAWV